MNRPILSICINTRNRAHLLVETLESITNQITNSVEIVVVDGASDDSTSDVMKKYVEKYYYIKYIQSDNEIGIDEGYDLSVKNASGDYCWLMPDDDIICEGALDIVISKIKNDFELIILNLELFTKKLNLDLNQRLFKFQEDKIYTRKQFGDFLSELGSGLSYIGCVVIRRQLWFEHNLSQFYGSFFIHVGVICASTQINKVLFLNKPLILYRSANSSWTPRSFEIWYFKWPNLIWSFENITTQVKNNITSRNPWNRGLTLLKSRAMGEYSYSIFRKSLASSGTSKHRLRNAFISLLPVTLLNLILVIFCLIFRRNNLYTLYILIMSSKRPIFLSKLSGLLGIKLHI
ncbi:glycosyltransferase [Candidatus Pseudothioglobus singularis]|nr:glycosyltransferase [Candidatus Pseudothioglobus singularis]